MIARIIINRSQNNNVDFVQINDSKLKKKERNFLNYWYTIIIDVGR